MAERIHWHRCSVDEALAALGTSADGLSAEEAQSRLERYGPNELPRSDAPSAWSILLDQLKNVLIAILLVATLVSGLLGDLLEAVVIAVIVLFAVLLGFVQEYRAERAMDSLRRMAAPLARVVRNSRPVTIPSRDVVPGDLVLLSAGDRIPADLRLMEAVALRVNEAALTGESNPVGKTTGRLADLNPSLGERSNMAYSGTDVTYGRGRGIAVATALDTELGKVTGMLAGVETARTPLQHNLDRVGRTLAIAAGLVVALIAALGVLRGAPLLDMFIFGVALAVAVVPEALPAVVTISLAIGVQRMVKRHALVRRLPTVETLGSTSVICSDKTGTLTRDQMTVREIWLDSASCRLEGSGYEPVGKIALSPDGPAERAALMRLLESATLCCDATLAQEDGRWRLHGDPTEGALVVAARKAGVHTDAHASRAPRIDEIPFSSERKRMTTLHREGAATFACSKGAAEIVLAGCSHIATAEGALPLDDALRLRVREASERMAKQALRVLAIAVKPDTDLAHAEHSMILLGLVGMMDPPRPEARAAIEDCEQAGIRAVMITGDHPDTAAAVACELGILKRGRMVTGADLDAMSQADLAQQIEAIEVFARVSPEHKLRVVQAWQSQGRICAMTGDGVNDAPALKKADVGVAMGVSGTDVSREAADMTLTDDNFASIVAAIEEGRAIFSNIKKYLMYLLSSNIGEIGLMAVATLAGMPLPLSAVQILYVNLATDGLPALALAFDPPERGLMRRLPRNPETGIFTGPVVLLMLLGGLWSTLVNIGLFHWALEHGAALGLDESATLSHAMTLTFLSLVLIQFFKAYSFRSDRESLMRQPFANRWLNLAVLWELCLLTAVLYVPVLAQAFGVYPLGPEDWLIVVGTAATVVPVLELGKWAVRRWSPEERVDAASAPA